MLGLQWHVPHRHPGLGRHLALAISVIAIVVGPAPAGAAPSRPGPVSDLRKDGRVLTRPHFLVPPQHRAPVEVRPRAVAVKRTATPRPSLSGSADPPAGPAMTNTWGRNTEGQLGNGTIDGVPVLTPTQQKCSFCSLNGTTMVSSGEYHTLAVNTVQGGTVLA